MSALKAVPARFDRASQHRRSMLAKVHVAKKELNLSDDDYEAILLDVTGNASAGNCTDAELDRVIKRFESKGFRPKAKASGAKPASHPAAGKARALWISLYHLGAIHNSSEKALEAFAKRQLGCDKLQWADQSQSYLLIEGLKAMAERHGWSMSLEGVQPGAALIVLKRRLVVAIFNKLRAAGLVPDDWPIQRAIVAFGGTDCPMALTIGTVSELDLIAREFGRTLRQLAGRLA